jgi:hypothetical protein
MAAPQVKCTDFKCKTKPFCNIVTDDKNYWYYACPSCGATYEVRK